MNGAGSTKRKAIELCEKGGRNSSNWGFQHPEDMMNRGRLNAKDLMSILTKAGEGSH